MHPFNSFAFYGTGAGSELICMQPPTIWQSWLGNLRELQLSTNLAELWVVVTKGRRAERRRVVWAAEYTPQIACSLFMAANVSSFARHKFVMQATGSGPTASGNNSPL